MDLDPQRDLDKTKNIEFGFIPKNIGFALYLKYCVLNEPNMLGLVFTWECWVLGGLNNVGFGSLIGIGPKNSRFSFYLRILGLVLYLECWV